MALTNNAPMLNFTTKYLFNLGFISETIVTTMKRLFPLSNISRLPPSLPASSPLLRMNNWRLAKAPLGPLIALIYLTSFSDSFLIWVLSLHCILEPLLTPSLRFFYVAATESPMVASSPRSTPLWRFMKVLKPSIPVLFCNSSAFRLLKIWVSHRKTEDCLRQALMNLPLPQALDFLHSQLLSSNVYFTACPQGQ